MSLRFIATLALIALLPITTANARAISPDNGIERVTARIHYGDLDLGSNAGREVLDRRTARSVRRACSQNIIGTYITQSNRRCQRELTVLAEARAHILITQARPRQTVAVR